METDWIFRTLLNFCYCRKLLRSSFHPHISQPQFLQREPPSGCSFYFLWTLQAFLDYWKKSLPITFSIAKGRSDVAWEAAFDARSFGGHPIYWVALFLLQSPEGCLKCRQERGNALARPVGGQAVIPLACRKEGSFRIQNHGLREQHQNCWERAPTLLSLPLQKSWNKNLPVKPRDSSAFRHFLVPFSVH